MNPQNNDGSVAPEIQKRDLKFEYPENLVAQTPQENPRVMWVDGSVPVEIDLETLLRRIPAGDLLLLNNTKVLRRRVFAGPNRDLEILFLKELKPREWEVLFPSRNLKIGNTIELPEGVTATLTQKGRPQRLTVDRDLSEFYFETHAELPLPPYIQAARGDRHNRGDDKSWYQTAWAKKAGSLAAPTASLHFKPKHIEALRQKGVLVCELTLHVGLGTFLPLAAEKLTDHEMHFESVSIPKAVIESVKKAQAENRGIWALGTTVARSIESYAAGLLQENAEGFAGETNLFLYPGKEFQVVNRLMTNFHQPESTLLALVGAFYGLERVKMCYQWAIQNQFRLFSYGDLSVWKK